MDFPLHTIQLLGHPHPGPSHAARSHLACTARRSTKPRRHQRPWECSWDFKDDLIIWMGFSGDLIEIKGFNWMFNGVYCDLMVINGDFNGKTSGIIMI